MKLKTYSTAPPETEPPYGDANAFMGPLPVSLDLRFRNGNRCGFSYSFLSEMEYDGSGMVSLMFGGVRVEIRGRNLLELYERLLLHGIGHVRESPTAAAVGGDSWPFIEAIMVRQEEA